MYSLNVLYRTFLLFFTGVSKLFVIFVLQCKIYRKFVFSLGSAPAHLNIVFVQGQAARFPSVPPKRYLYISF